MSRPNPSTRRECPAVERQGRPIAPRGSGLLERLLVIARKRPQHPLLVAPHRGRVVPEAEEPLVQRPAQPADRVLEQPTGVPHLR